MTPCTFQLLKSRTFGNESDPGLSKEYRLQWKQGKKQPSLGSTIYE